MPKLRRSTQQKMNVLLQNLENCIAYKEAQNSSISTSDVEWQLLHIMAVAQQVILGLKSPKTKGYSPKFSLMKLVVMQLHFIPRGKAKAPKSVLNFTKLSTEALRNQYQEMKQNLVPEWDALPEDFYFTHPYFGDMRLSESFDFLYIHSLHHYKIIKDIIANIK